VRTPKRHIYTADCETDPFLFGRVPLPFLWVLYDGKTNWQFRTTEAFVAHTKKLCGLCYVHNGGRFDFAYLWPHIHESTPMRIIHGRVVSFQLGKMEFRDSYAILPIALAQYNKDEIDYTKLEADRREDNADEIARYCVSDCANLYALVMVFRATHGDALTLAGASFRWWRKHCLDKGKVYTSTPHFYNIFRPYFRGGRCEAFRVGEIKEPFEGYDINSAYPFAMTQKLPWYGIEYRSSLAGLTDDEIARAFIRLECCSNGALPTTDKDGVTHYNHDATSHEYTITGHEYLAGIATETITCDRIREVIALRETIDFADFVEHWHARKQDAKRAGDKGAYWIAKLVLNSLYGKFATNPEHYRNYSVWPAALAGEIQRHGSTIHGFLNEEYVLVSDPTPEEERQYYNLATAASITGFVRAYLWRSLCASATPIYCDTDCIFASRVVVPKGKELGEWDSCGKFSYGAVAGKKLYAFKDAKGAWKTAAKGVRLEPTEIIQLARGETVTYRQAAPVFGILRGNPGAEKRENNLRLWLTRSLSGCRLVVNKEETTDAKTGKRRNRI